MLALTAKCVSCVFHDGATYYSGVRHEGTPSEAIYLADGDPVSVYDVAIGLSKPIRPAPRLCSTGPCCE
jgi:hypothetical protein